MSALFNKFKNKIIKKKKSTNDQETETRVQMESEFSKLNISSIDSNPVITNNKNCSYCNKPFIEELWCKECDPFRVIEGWSSGNSDIDKFIKDTMYDARHHENRSLYEDEVLFLEWVPFDRFEDIEQIGEGGFAKVYSATWIDGQSVGYNNGWKKLDPEPMEIALKRLNGSQNILTEYLNEIKTHWKFYLKQNLCVKFYGMTKDPITKEFLMIMEIAAKGNLRSILSSNFNNIFWKDKIYLLWTSIYYLKNLHEMRYFHKDFHSGNILHREEVGRACISDFGLSGPANEPKSDDKICGVLPYIAPEVLNGKQYTLSSDIYSFGVIMAEVSSGKPPFHKRKHDTSLALAICNGLRPEFGKGTPEIYKKLAYRCMNANPDQRPTADELNEILYFWRNSTSNYESYKDDEEFGHKGKEIKSMFEEANKEIPNISTSHEKDPDAIYTSRVFTFNNLPKPINSSIITSYLNDEDCQDSQAFDLGISSSLQLRDIAHENDVNDQVD